MSFAKDHTTPWFHIKVHEQLPQSLQVQVATLDKSCFPWLSTQTPEEKSETEDKFCSNKDMLAHILAFENEKVIGITIIYKRSIKIDDKSVVLGGIGSVCTDETKRNRGVASALTQTAIQELKKQNCDIAYLCTDIKNESLQRLYEKNGFVLLKKPHTYLGKSGKRYTEEDGMLAPVNSLKLFKYILETKEGFDIGIGNW